MCYEQNLFHQLNLTLTIVHVHVIFFDLSFHYTIRTDEDKGIATGSKSGQICIWDLYRSTKDIVVSILVI